MWIRDVIPDREQDIRAVAPRLRPAACQEYACEAEKEWSKSHRKQCSEAGMELRSPSSSSVGQFKMMHPNGSTRHPKPGRRTRIFRHGVRGAGEASLDSNRAQQEADAPTTDVQHEGTV